eukprot:403347426
MGNVVSTSRKSLMQLVALVSIMAAVIFCARRRGGFDNREVPDPHDYYKIYGVPVPITLEETKNLDNFPNKKSWVVVTGGSDSLGLQFCEKLAKHGFNLCIIGNDEKLVKDKLRKIQMKNSDIQTMYIQSMYGKINVNRDYREAAQRIKSLDISMLFINSSWNGVFPLNLIPNSQVEEMINLNIMQSLFLAKNLLPVLTSRSMQTAIVFTSSFLEMAKVGGKSSNQIGKRMVGMLAESLYHELNNLSMIDILTFEALTKSHNYLKKIGEDTQQQPILNMISKDLLGPDLQTIIQNTPKVIIKSKTFYGINIKAKNKDLESGLNQFVREIKEDYEFNMNDGGRIEPPKPKEEEPIVFEDIYELEVILGPQIIEIFKNAGEDTYQIKSVTQSDGVQIQVSKIERESIESVHEEEIKQKGIYIENVHQGLKGVNETDFQDDYLIKAFVQDEEHRPVQQAVDREVIESVHESEVILAGIIIEIIGALDKSQRLAQSQQKQNVKGNDSKIIDHIELEEEQIIQSTTHQDQFVITQKSINREVIESVHEEEVQLSGLVIEMVGALAQALNKSQNINESLKKSVDHIELEEMQQIQSQIQQDSVIIVQKVVEREVIESMHEDEVKCPALPIETVKPTGQDGEDVYQIVSQQQAGEYLFEQIITETVYEDQYNFCQLIKAIPVENVAGESEQGQQIKEEEQEIYTKSRLLKVTRGFREHPKIDNSEAGQTIEIQESFDIKLEDDGIIFGKFETPEPTLDLQNMDTPATEDTPRSDQNDDDFDDGDCDVGNDEDEDIPLNEGDTTNIKEGVAVEVPGNDSDDDDDEEEKKEEAPTVDHRAFFASIKAAMATTFKERAYKAVKGDAVDKFVEDIVFKRNIECPIVRIAASKYLIGTETKMLIIKGDSCMVRVGGGFEKLDEYLVRNSDSELEKIRKMMNEQKKSFHQIIVTLLNKYTKDQTVIQNYKKYSRFNLPARFANGSNGNQATESTPTPKSKGSKTNKTGGATETPKSRTETPAAGGSKLMSSLFGGSKIGGGSAFGGGAATGSANETPRGSIKTSTNNVNETPKSNKK